MDDPWDVKSVRQSGQYISCMKINGVPLLPPVLSKECREEMQYYKLLAREVEKRISILQPYVDSETDSSEDKTDAPEIPECEPEFKLASGNTEPDCDVNITRKTTVSKENSLDKTLTGTFLQNEKCKSPSKLTDPAETSSPQFRLDFSLNINKTASNITEDVNIDSTSSSIEVPERDYNCIKSVELADAETKHFGKELGLNKDFINFNFTLSRNTSTNPLCEDSQVGPPTISCKSFTGSLNNIHMLKERGTNAVPKLVRQRSYTVLNPSPQLLAHLEIQSVNLGVDMSCISMSESLSNLSSPNKKRKSWNLELAKAKWSNMAMELNKKKLPEQNNKKHSNNTVKRPATNKGTSHSRAESVAAARTKYTSSAKPSTKIEPIQKTKTLNIMKDMPLDETIVIEENGPVKNSKEHNPIKNIKESSSPKVLNQNKGAHKDVSQAVREPVITTCLRSELQSHKCGTSKSKAMPESDNNDNEEKVSEVDKCAFPKSSLISESDDPAAKVRELYEKIQKQQHMQMASLIEKQKREQILLQQAFEEQNKLLFKQLKTICPKSPEEVKEAWVDKNEVTRGPVSLSQLIEKKSPEQKFDSPVSSTLTDSNMYINQCDSVLKRSRDISNSLKKLGNSQSQNGSKNQSPNTLSLTRTNSPNRRSTPASRRLHYDTSASSDRENEPILTDRTNDTMADLNVTFPSDSEEYRPFSGNCVNYLGGQDVTVIHKSSTPCSTDSAIKCMERTIQKSMNSSCALRNKIMLNYQATPKQQAAASKIVAHAKGYLVRRLMKTSRVQSTVQTIKDALLCALQLHQDREGIRGADVDLHRRLIQQITAACYSLHDTFITSTPAERCAMIAADRSRRASLASRSVSKRRHSDVMSQSHSGVFLPRPKRFSSSSTSLMTQSNYETYSSEKGGRARYMPSPRRRPWR